MSGVSNHFASWSAALAGDTPPLHEDQPWCGYFKMRDRRGLNKDLAPIKRPFVACAIWKDTSGEVKAELAGSEIPFDWLWPYCAKHPIEYETYAYWHKNEKWPEEKK